ncbi:hypothetical protein HMPREF9333_00673 [Johnsonella ignava ATCC 51276]|uniref:Uncharacterized protein n=1 Tax=Johnsonella ignava ATCC 51276 TaxID=679200 RepID=G5GGI3_9FIRM|nr:NusG domain II-containing protein [Johnsonella ignava]EHI56143.1 hypothetical protein HMPREF9333_00673 [Johnsonella ignava ATCC 51276]
MKFKKNEIIVILCIACISLAFVIYSKTNAKSAATAQLTYTYKYDDGSGRTEKREVDIPLNKNKTYDFQSMDYTIHIDVKDGAAAFVNSPCPDHKCEHYGYLKQSGESAVCLPARAVLVVK